MSCSSKPMWSSLEWEETSGRLEQPVLLPISLVEDEKLEGSQRVDPTRPLSSQVLLADRLDESARGRDQDVASQLLPSCSERSKTLRRDLEAPHVVRLIRTPDERVAGKGAVGGEDGRQC